MNNRTVPAAIITLMLAAPLAASAQTTNAVQSQLVTALQQLVQVLTAELTLLEQQLIAAHAATVNQCPAPPAEPTNISCQSNWQKIIVASGCHVGWTCITYTTSSTSTTSTVTQAPVITAVQGPLTITAGTSGTWVVQASSPSNGSLSYSMIWGDEGPSVSGILDLSGGGLNYSSSNSLTHIYLNSGAYTMIAYVKDSAGNTNKATLTVQVSSPQAVSATAPATTATTGASCGYSGQTYTEGQQLASWCPASPTQGICNGPYVCHNGQWAPTTQSAAASCAFNGMTYANGSTIGCTVDKGMCPPGLYFSKCSNGPWIAQ
jgi:PKD domain-containing protein